MSASYLFYDPFILLESQDLGGCLEDRETVDVIVDRQIVL